MAEDYKTIVYNTAKAALEGMHVSGREEEILNNPDFGPGKAVAYDTIFRLIAKSLDIAPGDLENILVAEQFRRAYTSTKEDGKYTLIIKDGRITVLIKTTEEIKK